MRQDMIAYESGRAAGLMCTNMQDLQIRVILEDRGP